MKLYSIIFPLFFLVSCKAQVGNDQKETSSNPQESITNIACKICTIEDSLQEVESELYMYKALGKDVKDYEVVQSRITSKRDSLLKIFNDNRNQGNSSFKSSIQLAKDECMLQYPLMLIKDSSERVENFNGYLAYSRYHNFPQLIDPSLDTTLLNKAKSGNFLLRVKGKDIEVTRDSIFAYWNNMLKEYYKCQNYLNEKVNIYVSRITGKPLKDLSPSEKIALELHATKIDLNSGQNLFKIIQNDKELNKLKEQFDLATLNKL